MSTVIGRANIVCKQPKVPQEGLVLRSRPKPVSKQPDRALSGYDYA